MRLLTALSLFLAILVPVVATPRQAEAASCQFVLGFKALHDLAPAIVGNCLDDEHHNAVNGDALQETTGPAGGARTGLLVWRKADNWTAFTDGFHTWINGPYGLQERLNTACFSWEAGCTQPASVASANLVGFQSFAQLWEAHGFSLQVNVGGTGDASWRIYKWCTDGPPPCDMTSGNLIEDGGAAHLVFYQVNEATALAHIVTSTDPATLLPGSTAALALLPYDEAQFSPAGESPFTLCGPDYPNEAPTSVFATYPCGV